MKKLLIALALAAGTLVQTVYAQTATPPLLSLYYDVKDALVKGDAVLASAKAQDFVNAVDSAGEKLLGENRQSLLRDARSIAKKADLKIQREAFSSFSDTMASLAKASKLSPEPVYKQYCPMKKSYWLSNEKTIKNPYYGSSMLTCGSVVETL